MTPRTIRRAAERKALKAARRTASQQAPITTSAITGPAPTEPFESIPNYLRDAERAAAIERVRATVTARSEGPPTTLVDAVRAEIAEFRAAAEQKSRSSKPLSEARLSANLANAQKSTGPRTTEGRSAIRLNALKTGLTGITIVISDDELPVYEAHLNGYQDEFEPQTARERALVQSIADSDWRRLRIAHLEMSYHASGHIEFSDQPQIVAIGPLARQSMIEILVEEKYEKEFRNLRLQDGRLHRRGERDLAELRRTIADRKATQQQEARALAEPKTIAPSDPTPAVGSEFSTPAAPLIRHACAASTTPTTLQNHDRFVLAAAARTGERVDFPEPGI